MSESCETQFFSRFREMKNSRIWESITAEHIQTWALQQAYWFILGVLNVHKRAGCWLHNRKTIYLAGWCGHWALVGMWYYAVLCKILFSKYYHVSSIVLVSHLVFSERWYFLKVSCTTLKDSPVPVPVVVKVSVVTCNLCESGYMNKNRDK